MTRSLVGFLAFAAAACSARSPRSDAFSADGTGPCPGANPASAEAVSTTLDSGDPRIRPVRNAAYPSIPGSLYKPGARGRAMVSYAIDTLGGVDPQSIMILSSDAPQWSAAICKALPRRQHAPIEINGARVRVRIIHAFEYFVDP